MRDALDELYLWYRELPAVDPVRFDSPEAYLDAVRYRPLDTSFSYITSRAASDSFYSESQYIGFGLSTSMSGDEMRVLQVFADSPAAEAGLARGARITEHRRRLDGGAGGQRRASTRRSARPPTGSSSTSSSSSATAAAARRRCASAR